jgi:hypothetical protein
MALNTAPIYSGVGDIQWTTVLTAVNSSYDAITANVATVFSASISGSFVQRIRFKASGSTTATAARIFINNGSPSGSAENNVLFDEITLPLTTGTQTAATAVYELSMNIALPPAYRILATLATAQSVGGGWYASAIGGSYVTPQ